MKISLIYFALVFRIIQQQPGDFLYFSLDPSHMTESQAPGILCPQAETTMLLIESSPVVHSMAIGERITIETRRGHEVYIIQHIDRLQAPGGANPWGNFVAESGGKEYTARDAFFYLYCNPMWKVNIQTCYDGLNRMIVHAVTLDMWRKLSLVE